MDIGLGTALSGIGGLASGVLSGISASKNRKFQREENQKDRDFNAAQSALARQFSLDMYNRQNDYNNPINQMQRLQSAGINPALAYSGSQGIMPAGSSSPSNFASHSGSYSSPLPDFSGIAQAGNAALQGALTKAQIDNINANTQNVNTDTEGKKQDNRVKTIKAIVSEANKDNMITLGNLEVSNVKQINANLAQEFQKLGAEVSNLYNLSAKTYNEAEILRVDLSLKERLWANVVEMSDLDVKQKRIVVDTIRQSIMSQIALNFGTASAQNALASRLGFQNIYDTVTSGLPIYFDDDGVYFDLEAVQDFIADKIQVQKNKFEVEGNKVVIWTKEILNIIGQGISEIYNALNVWRLVDPEERTTTTHTLHTDDFSTTTTQEKRNTRSQNRREEKRKDAMRERIESKRPRLVFRK